MSIAALRFLVTEDHDVQRNALVMALGRLGATTVHQAADGHGALKILEDPARPVDIVITDLDMPGMDGMEFVRHLGESGDSISIILASALDYKLLASIATMSEGVETQAHFDMLCALGCDMAQGYFIARPMECADLIDWARDWKQSGAFS